MLSPRSLVNDVDSLSQSRPAGPDQAKAVSAIAERVGPPVAGRPPRLHGLSVQAPGQAPGRDRALGARSRRCRWTRGSCPRPIPSSPESIRAHSSSAVLPRRSRERTSSSTPAASASTRSTRPPTRAASTCTKLVTIERGSCRISDRIYNPVPSGRRLRRLAHARPRKNFGYTPRGGSPLLKPGGKPDDPITAVEHVSPVSRLPQGQEIGSCSKAAA